MGLLGNLSQIDLLKTARYRISQKSQIDLTVYRNTFIKLGAGASITGDGALSVGVMWPAYCAYKTMLTVWDGGSLTVDGSFSIFTGCRVVVDKDAKLEIGSGGLNCNSVISCFNHIKIGKETFIGENVILRDSDNHLILNGTQEAGTHVAGEPITIGDHVLIGIRAIILKGVTIGSGSVIAAGSVVTKNIPAHVLAGGVPAKVIREGVGWR